MKSVPAETKCRACMLAYAFYETDGRIIRYAETLERDGYSVDAIVIGRPGAKPAESINNVHVLRIQTREKNEKGKFSYLFRIVMFLLRSTLYLSWRHFKNPYDVIHVHSVPDFEVFATLLAKLFGAKVILDIHDMVPEFYANKFGVDNQHMTIRALRMIEKMSGRFADHVIIANALWHDKIIARSIPKDKCTAFINFPDADNFHRGLGSRGSDGRFVIIYPGSLNYHQGLDIALEAFAKSRDEMPGSEFHIYGEGPEKARLAEIIDRENLRDFVRIESPLPLKQIATVMANADIGVVPKRDDDFGGEAFSTKVMEFMLLGVPLVVSETKIDKYYFDESTVRFFESGSVSSLAEALIDVYCHREKNLERADKAHTYASGMTWQSREGDYLALVKQLINDR